MKKHLAILALAPRCVSEGPANLRAAGGYFRVEQRLEVWWFVTPSGKLTLSAGVNHVSLRSQDCIPSDDISPS